jgi:hypothetical protein
MYEIIFISYQEPNADENFAKLKARFPRAQRVHGVKGIHQAHIAAAKKSFTKMFWVVDGDAEIIDTFNFDYVVSKYDLECVHVWHSKNPVNDLEYGYGGIKLLPKYNVLNMNFTKPDMTTSLSDKFKVIPEVSNVTKFNTDSFNSWKSAFRECVKLSSKAIDRNYEEETEKRLEIWRSVGIEKPFGEYVLLGANEGYNFGVNNIGNNEVLSKINDFDWLSFIFKDNDGKV